MIAPECDCSHSKIFFSHFYPNKYRKIKKNIINFIKAILIICKINLSMKSMKIVAQIEGPNVKIFSMIKNSFRLKT